MKKLIDFFIFHLNGEGPISLVLLVWGLFYLIFGLLFFGAAKIVNSAVVYFMLKNWV